MKPWTGLTSTAIGPPGSRKEDLWMFLPSRVPPALDNAFNWSGQVGAENTSVVERTMHLVGHAKLWKQLRGSNPGTIVMPTRKPNR